MLWFFLLVLVLGLVFGWHVAGVLLVLWLIGYVGFWLFMLCKPVKPVPTRAQHASRAGAERVDGPGEGVTEAIALP